jgi:hypothetical protein
MSEQTKWRAASSNGLVASVAGEIGRPVCLRASAVCRRVSIPSGSRFSICLRPTIEARNCAGPRRQDRCDGGECRKSQIRGLIILADFSAYMSREFLYAAPEGRICAAGPRGAIPLESSLREPFGTCPGESCRTAPVQRHACPRPRQDRSAGSHNVFLRAVSQD